MRTLAALLLLCSSATADTIPFSGTANSWLRRYDPDLRIITLDRPLATFAGVLDEDAYRITFEQITLYGLTGENVVWQAFDQIVQFPGTPMLNYLAPFTDANAIEHNVYFSANNHFTTNPLLYRITMSFNNALSVDFGKGLHDYSFKVTDMFAGSGPIPEPTCGVLALASVVCTFAGIRPSRMPVVVHCEQVTNEDATINDRHS